jgi:hypothetical protein
MGSGNGAGGARIALNQVIYIQNYSYCVNLLCKYSDATFRVLIKRHLDAIERIVQMPNKVHPLTLEAILYLRYIFQL